MTLQRPLTNIGKFNQSLDKLIGICLDNYPEDQIASLKHYQYQLELGRSTNQKLVVEKIMAVLGHCIHHIMKRDQDAFLTYDLNEISSDPKETAIINNLRNIWETINCHDKVWQLLQLIIMYGTKITRNEIYLATINMYRAVPLTFD